MAEGQRRRVLDTGVGTNLLSTFTGQVSESIQRRRKAEEDLAMVFQKALAEEEIKNRFDPEHITQNRILTLQGKLQPTPTPTVPGFGSGYTIQERSLGLPAEVEEANRSRNAPVQGQIDTLLRVMGKRPEQSLEDIYARSFAAAGGRAAAGQPRQDFLDSSKVRDEFINRPEVKEYVTIQTQVRSMDSLLREAKTGNVQNKVALDQGLITLFNKLTDPNSVVRESEYERTPQNISFANRFSGALQRLSKGGAGLTDSDREALVWGAKVIADERGRTFNDTFQDYTTLGTQYGIDPSLITRGISPHQAYIIGKEQSSVSQNQKSSRNHVTQLIRVREKSGRKRKGYIPINEFDATQYERL